MIIPSCNALQKSDKKEAVADDAVGLELNGTDKDGAEDQGCGNLKVTSAELNPNTTVVTIPGKKEEKVESGSKQERAVKESPIDKELMQVHPEFGIQINQLPFEVHVIFGKEHSAPFIFTESVIFCAS